MAQQTINNGEAGGVVRGKLNSNFTELYNLTANPYPRVLDFASLPAASSATGLIYVVETSTGIWPFRRSAGMWISNGAAWSWLGNESLIAEQITFTAGGTIAAVNVQAAILELDSEFAARARAETEAEIVAGANVTITPSGSGATRQLTIAAASGGAGLTGATIITVPNTFGGAFEWIETVTATGVVGTNKINVTLSPHLDDDENSQEMLDISAIAATAGVGTITITAAFPELTSGPIKLYWSAF